jgi:DNA-binding CsgD family transcriptional regulator/tetratricopeptide (TPR) repeat protein
MLGSQHVTSAMWALYVRRAMTKSRTGEVLIDRRREREAFDGLLNTVREGLSQVLVVLGEPGVGKTALLGYAVGEADGFKIIRAGGVESEMELPYAALQLLCAGELNRLERLPTPQRDALSVAFGVSRGEAPDRFLVGLAVLSLMSDIAEEKPLLCIVDDAQWLDRASAQVLAFVGRRMLAEGVGMIFAMRGADDDFRGLPEVHVTGLEDSDARSLLSAVVKVPIDHSVRDRIITEARGNPLALLELSRAPTALQLAGGFGLPGVWPRAAQLEDSFRRRLTALPAETQLLLLVAAAEPLGDPILLWRAAEHLGLKADAAAAAADEELLAVGARVSFRHPLIRSAAYRTSPPEARRAAHAALAEVTDPNLDPDRRAWHRAQATVGPDEAAAAELEASAERAEARGGLAAAAAFLDRAAVLTPDPARRTQRSLSAAAAKVQSGSFETALRLLAAAETGRLDESQRATVDLLRGRIAFVLNAGSHAPPLLLRAARRLELLDPRAARATYLEALGATLRAGRLSSQVSVREVAEAILAAPTSSDPPAPADGLLTGLAVWIVNGPQAGAPILAQALDALTVTSVSAREELSWLWLAGHGASLLWDNERWELLSSRFVQLPRDAGALGVLPVALNHRASLLLFGGELALAASFGEEAASVNDATGGTMAPYGALGLAAFSGQEREAKRLIDIATEDVLRRGEGVGLTFVQWAASVLYNGLGQYDVALEFARQAASDGPEQRFSTWARVELIEAATRIAMPDVANDALGSLLATTDVSRTDWAAGTAAYARALCSDGDEADRLYRSSIDRFASTSLKVPLARCQLAYGEWLRRERRRVDAREHLRVAHDLFVRFGMGAFAQRARVELMATGETARRRVAETRDELTPQEAQICRLAAHGATNREIGAQLFISPSTVDYHLRKAFRKLGVRSRTQLARFLLGPSDTHDLGAPMV